MVVTKLRVVKQTNISRTYKLQIVGPGDVGKSALTLQFVRNIFLDEYDPTIEDSYRKQCVIDNEPAFVDLLDTAGQEEYSALRDQYLMYGDGFMIVYSVTERNSFERIQSFWQQISRAKDLEPFPAILVANKCDLESERQVQTKEGRELARQLGCEFMETSAKCKVNVDRSFYNLIRSVRKAKNRLPREHTSSRCILM